MSDIDQGLRALTEKARNKKNSGKPLSAAEQALLDVALGHSARAEAPVPARADTLDQAVGLLQPEFPQLNKPLLRRLLKLPAFKKARAGNRFILAELSAVLRAHFASPTSSGPHASAPRHKDVVEAEIAEEKLIRERRKNAIEAGKYYQAPIVDAWIGQTQAAVKSILQKKLKNELPPRLEGLRAPEISAKMDPVIAEIVKLFRFCHVDPAENETAEASAP